MTLDQYVLNEKNVRELVNILLDNWIPFRYLASQLGQVIQVDQAYTPLLHELFRKYNFHFEKVNKED